jgi:hypothetical protein
MSGLAKGLTEDQVLRRVVEKVCEQVWSQDKTAIKEALAQPEQEPVAWPCLIDSVDFSANTITLVMQCEDYKVSARKHWLSITPPQRTWVGLTPEETDDIIANAIDKVDALIQTADKLKDKNT